MSLLSKPIKIILFLFLKQKKSPKYITKYRGGNKCQKEIPVQKLVWYKQILGYTNFELTQILSRLFLVKNFKDQTIFWSKMFWSINIWIKYFGLKKV